MRLTWLSALALVATPTLAYAEAPAAGPARSEEVRSQAQRTTVMRRSDPVLYGFGIAVTLVGGGLIVGGTSWLMNETVYAGFHDELDPGDARIMGTLIGAGALVAVTGIVMLVTGDKRVRVDSPPVLARF